MATQNNKGNVITSQPSLRGTKQSHEATENNQQIASSLAMTQARVPKLRFKEFEGNEEGIVYERHSFQDIFIFSTGKNIKQKEASPEFETPCVRYGELYHMYNEVIHQVINSTNLDKSELLFSEGNEILLPSAGEDPLDIGSASALTVPNVAIGRTINILKPKEDNLYSQIYVSYYINEKLRKKISTLAKGSSISNVYNSDLKKLKINLPNLPEQQKIANFLTAVDTKLQQLTTKKETLAQYKKGVMQQLFSQQLRFKPDNTNETVTARTQDNAISPNETQFPDWEEKKLGEVCTFLDGRRKPIKSEDRAKMKGEYPYYGASGIIDYVNGYLFDEDIILLGEDGENIISRNLPLAFRVSGKCWINNHAHVIKPNENIDIDFLTYTLERINYVPYNTGTAQPKLNQKVCRNIEINLTSLKEQQKIATYLSAIDSKIETVQTQITKTQAFKKGLLQAMFV